MLRLTWSCKHSPLLLYHCTSTPMASSLVSQPDKYAHETSQCKGIFCSAYCRKSLRAENHTILQPPHSQSINLSHGGLVSKSRSTGLLWLIHQVVSTFTWGEREQRTTTHHGPGVKKSGQVCTAILHPRRRQKVEWTYPQGCLLSGSEPQNPHWDGLGRWQTDSSFSDWSHYMTSLYTICSSCFITTYHPEETRPRGV